MAKVIDFASVEPSTDPLGVKRWRFDVQGLAVDVYDRPPSYASSRWVYRLYDPAGRCLRAGVTGRRKDIVRMVRAAIEEEGKVSV